MPLETLERADLFHPWARGPARWPLADLKGVVPTRSQSNQYGIQVHFPRIGPWASGNGASMSLRPSLEPLEQDQQRLLMSTGYSPKSGPSHFTNLHHECFSHGLREPKQLASGHTAGMQPTSAPEPRSVRPDPEDEPPEDEPAGFSPPPKPNLGLIPEVWSGCVAFGNWLLIKLQSCFDVGKSEQDLDGPTR